MSPDSNNGAARTAAWGQPGDSAQPSTGPISGNFSLLWPMPGPEAAANSILPLGLCTVGPALSSLEPEKEVVDGTKETRTGGSLAWRANNPGNQIITPWTKKEGAIGHYLVVGPPRHDQAIYPDISTGEKAEEDLMTGSGFQSLSIAGMINKYAPQNNGNNPVSYGAAVAAAVGLPADKPLSTLSPSQMKTLISTIEKIEGFKAGTVTITSNSNGSTTISGEVNRIDTRIPVKVSCTNGVCQ